MLKILGVKVKDKKKLKIVLQIIQIIIMAIAVVVASWSAHISSLASEEARKSSELTQSFRENLLDIEENLLRIQENLSAIQSATLELDVNAFLHNRVKDMIETAQQEWSLVNNELERKKWIENYGELRDSLDNAKEFLELAQDEWFYANYTQADNYALDSHRIIRQVGSELEAVEVPPAGLEIPLLLVSGVVLLIFVLIVVFYGKTAKARVRSSLRI